MTKGQNTPNNPSQDKTIDCVVEEMEHDIGDDTRHKVLER